MEHTLEWERPRLEFDAEQRRYDDTTTWLAELLKGSMRTPFEYRFDGHELFAHDNSALGPIFQDAIEAAHDLAGENPQLAFEVRRRQIELDEYEHMLKMARGEVPNTLVVVSDFPAELTTASEDVGGYNVSRQQTMLRVLAVDGRGRLQMYSQSLDQSHRPSLEAMYHSLGFVPQSGELLGQRMSLQLAHEDQEFLVDQLTGVYDRSLQQHFGGEWYAGLPSTVRARGNTYDFVRTQTDLLAAYEQRLREGCPIEVAQLDLAAAVERRFEKGHDVNPVQAIAKAVYGGQAAMLEMVRAGEVARAEGRSYSACGMTLKGQAGSETTAQGELTAAGYGNKSAESKTLPSLIRCINCKQKVPSKEVVKDKSWCCPKCKYEIDVCTGKVLCSGTAK